MSDAPSSTDTTTLDAETILDVTVRFWAELGRMKLPIGQAVALAEGSIVDLDRKPEEPVDVYVNGTHFGSGRLIMVEGEWALQLEAVDTLLLEASAGLAGVEQASSPSPETG
jgi:flagellar motor switch protein FliN/FliY